LDDKIQMPKMYSFDKVRELIKEAKQQARLEMREKILEQMLKICFIDCQRVDKIINLIKNLK